MVQPFIFSIGMDAMILGLLVASSVYFYRLSAGELKNVRRIILLRKKSQQFHIILLHSSFFIAMLNSRDDNVNRFED